MWWESLTHGRIDRRGLARRQRVLTGRSNTGTEQNHERFPRSPPASACLPALTTSLLMAERALASIPAQFAEHVRDVGVVVEDHADDATLHEMNIKSPWELSGLYRGMPLTHRSVMDPVRQPDRIFLYREAILLEWIETGEDLYRLVRNVVVHEVAHHFGFSDADIEAIEQNLR